MASREGRPVLPKPLLARPGAARIAILITLLLAACGPQSREPDLRRSFPERAIEVIDRGRPFTATGEGLASAVPARRSFRGESLTAVLPRDAGSSIKIRVGAGFEATVREIGVEGAATVVGRSVAYRRIDGTSYWCSPRAGGVEEWLHLERGRAYAGRAVAAWDVEGAELRQRGTTVELVDGKGDVRVRVTSPRAYAGHGRIVDARLAVSGKRIELSADADGEEALIDPQWNAAGDMIDGREFTTATLLGAGSAHAGEVLLTGGWTGASTVPHVERFDPASTTWTPVADMGTPHDSHTATELVPGKVLVAAGYDPAIGSTTAAEIYDASTNKWTPTGPLVFPRYFHAATRLQDGRVLVTGGTFGGPGPEAEIYDPAMGQWKQVTPMSSSRFTHTSTLLADGRVLVAGGGYAGSSADSSSELYDPATDSWTFTSVDMAFARTEHTATLLPDGRVLVTGGYDPFNPLAEAEIYDPATDIWTLAATMSWVRAEHSAALLGDGTVLVAGGTQQGQGYGGYGKVAGPSGLGSGSGMDTSERYDPASDTWLDAGFMAFSRRWHATTALANGDVLVVGGDDGSGTVLTSAEIFTLDPNGTGCAIDLDCASSHCVDGVCCDGACSGTCESCVSATNGLGVDGVCAPIVAGTNPDGDCAASAPSTCGDDGVCDGAGACEKFSAGTQCSPQSCSGSTETLASSCDGAGTCVPGGTASCGNYLCVGVTCRSSCSADADCIGSAFCFATACVPKKPNGAACGALNECLSAACADGVCCTTACSGVCQACTAVKKGSGADGTCGPVANGADPDAECGAQAASTCGTDGSCDGAGACRKYVSGTVCVPQSCSGASQVNASTCNGGGTCVPGATVGCGNYVCSGTACLSSCATSADCAAGNFCSGSACVPLLPNGAACAAASQCQSAACTDSVCCNVACGGTCQACTAAKKGSGVDGTCGPVASGADPDNDCSAQAAATCGNDGSCDGAGACRKYVSGTVCSPQSCSGNTQVNASTCDGGGACVAGGTTSCGSYICSGSACLAACSSNAQCAPGAYCNGSGCVPLQADGTACAGGAQCASGSCADGVCCNTACNTVCQACTAAKKGSGADGACGSIAAGSDPDSECAAQAASTCGTNGSCDGAGACQKYVAGTICAPSSCSGTQQINASTCDGSGACNGNGVTDCGAFACAGGVCLSTCAIDADCGVSGYCNNLVCAAKLADGAACAGPAQCQSSFCADGVCCDGPCSGGACDACSVAAGGPVDGTCSPLTGPSCDDTNPCTQSDACVAGVCTGSNPVSCLSQSACSDDGVCDPTTGACTPAPKPDGASCDDKDACTQTDTCSKGTCVGANPLVCNQPDQCHDAGKCDPLLGCLPGAKPDGTPCDDGSKCTQVDTCQAGACSGGSPVVCTPGPCQVSSTCDATSGLCFALSKPDGAPCGGGICIAGDCLPDPSIGSLSAVASSGSGATTGSGGAGGSGGESASSAATGAGGENGNGGAGPNSDPGKAGEIRLVGGCSSSEGESSAGRGVWIGLALLLAARARRRKG